MRLSGKQQNRYTEQKLGYNEQNILNNAKLDYTELKLIFSTDMSLLGKQHNAYSTQN